jgi:hypothetical protein
LQVFTPRADTLLRFTALLAALILAGLVAAGAGFAASTYASQVGWPQDQPVPFSHKHHVSDDGLDCRFCHTSVEQGPRAGLPSTQVCMTCHSQIWTGAEVLTPVRDSFASGRPLRWMRVAQVPDYVFFDHSIHVKRGVACIECHGRIDTMPLTWRAKPFQMQWCLDCHRDPAPRLRPASDVTMMPPPERPEAAARRFGERVLRSAHVDVPRLSNCETCHR